LNSLPLTGVIRRYWPSIRLVLRWSWFVLVTGFVLVFVRRNAEVISATLRDYTWPVLIATAGVTVVGKVVLSIQCGTITSYLGHRFCHRQTFWMYSASDVVKYVPGGIWNAVARVKLYADCGMARRHAAQAFALEKFWQVVGALATGAMALTPSLHAGYQMTLRGVASLLGEVLLLSLVWALLAYFGAHRITGRRPSIGFVIRSMVEQGALAVCLGAGVAIPMSVVDLDVGWLTAVGAFSIGRGLGYVAVFAPAGIGVREVVTLWALGRGVDTDLALVALGVNRVMTFAADVASFAAGVAMRPAKISRTPSVLEEETF